MIYNGCKIMAMVETYDIYELEEDGETLGQYQYDGGGDTDYFRYDAWTLDEDGDTDTGIGDFDTLEEAKTAIDNWIKEATTIQSEAGN